MEAEIQDTSSMVQRSNFGVMKELTIKKVENKHEKDDFVMLTDKLYDTPSLNNKGLFPFLEGTYQMGKKPYMEASVGIENIFNAIRVDYVWRLNYLDHPGIQKNGIRATIMLSF